MSAISVVLACATLGFNYRQQDPTLTFTKGSAESQVEEGSGTKASGPLAV